MDADSYAPLNRCPMCGRDFTSDAYFDRHRVGKHAYTFAEGLRLDPAREDGRRCMDERELLAAGLRPMTRYEMLGKYRSRIESGVPLYFDPARAEALRRRLGRVSKPVEGLREAA